MSKRKKTSAAAPPSVEAVPESVEIEIDVDVPVHDSVTAQAAVPADLMKQAMGEDSPTFNGQGAPEEAVRQAEAAEERAERAAEEAVAGAEEASAEHTQHAEEAPAESSPAFDSEAFDAEMTVNLAGDLLVPARDDLDEPTVTAPGEALAEIDRILVQRKHLRGLLEALVFASDSPIKPKELAKLASAQVQQVKELLEELKTDYSTRGMHLDEVAGGWVFRTSSQYAPFVRDLTKQKPVRLTRAQVETLAIIAYRQPVTRPEVDDVRGVDSGPVLKLLLERDLIRILGKRDEPGRPMIYGTTGNFLEFFGLKSLKDLPTLREFTELSDESREAFEEELGETPEDAARHLAEAEARAAGHALEDGGTHADNGGLGALEDEGGGGHRDAGHQDAGPQDAGYVETGPEEEDDLDGNADEGPHARAVRESMRVPIGEHPIDDLGADDLEPISVADPGGGDAVSDREPPAQHPGHASDEDGPTLTSEAPSSNDNDDD